MEEKYMLKEESDTAHSSVSMPPSFKLNVSAAAMSIVERVSGGRGWLLSHESFLEELYSKPHTSYLGLKPLRGIFDVRTPFRMDAEAEKVAASGSQEADEEPRKKKRKKSDSADTFPQEKQRCEEFLGAVEHKFEPPPSQDVIAENNKPVRELVKRLQSLNKDIYAPMSNTSLSSEIEVIGEKRYVLPAGSEYHLGDADDLLGWMVEARREVKDCSYFLPLYHK